MIQFREKGKTIHLIWFPLYIFDLFHRETNFRQYLTTYLDKFRI